MEFTTSENTKLMKRIMGKWGTVGDLGAKKVDKEVLSNEVAIGVRDEMEKAWEPLL